MIGYIIWCWNDEEWLRPCLSSFRDTTESIYLLGIATGTDTSKDIFCDYCDEVMDFPETNLCKIVNVGYKHLYDSGCDYLGQMHPDMTFHHPGWVDSLRCTLDIYPQIARISPYNIHHPRHLPGVHEGVEAGNLVRRDYFDTIGYYDEAYIGCGGYEDWDIQRRAIANNQGSYFTTASEVWHQHVGTRAKIDGNLRNQQWMHNQQVYYEKWGTYDNQMVPEGWKTLPLIA